MAKAHSTAPTFTAEQIANFWSKVDKAGPDDCWPWQASIAGKSGYGKFTVRVSASKTIAFGAHVLARFFATDEWPTAQCTCHFCDNKLCCNPAHLWLGTHAQNSADMVAKGRSHKEEWKGEDNHRSKMTEEQVREIRRLHAAGGVSYVQLGRQFDLHPVSIRLIVKRINWSHVA